MGLVDSLIISTIESFSLEVGISDVAAKTNTICTEKNESVKKL